MGGNMRILVVGDYQHYLQVKAVIVDHVVDYPEHGVPDLVLFFSDRSQDGDELYQLRKRYPSVKVVVLTGLVDQQHLMMALAYNILDYHIGVFDEEYWCELKALLDVK
jgi:DNA-binding NarL/FixJ family response regulator